MQKFDFTAPASGAPQVVNVPGRYIKYVTGNAGGNDAGLIITPGGKPGSKILLYPGQAVTLPSDGTAGPNAWTLANALGQAQISGTVVVGNGRIDDNTLQGVVSVVDGGKSRTLAGTAFTCMTNMVGAAPAGDFPRLQLWNPTASGKRLVVESLSLVVPAGGGYSTAANIVWMNVQLASTAPTQPQSKNPAVGVASATVQYDTPNAVVSTNVLYQLDANSASVFPFVPKEPLVVPPGWGLTVGGTTVASNLAMGFEWYEEPNV